MIKCCQRKGLAKQIKVNNVYFILLYGLVLQSKEIKTQFKKHFHRRKIIFLTPDTTYKLMDFIY